MKNKAFTLIELLVVVLIIGILAAIAVPQYQKAVLKANLHKGIPLVESLYQAQQAYYLTHGDFATDLDTLDISLPVDSSCTKKQTDSYSWYYCKNFGYIGIWDNFSNVQFAPKSFEISYLHYIKDDHRNDNLNMNAGETWCFASPNSDAAQSICTGMGGTLEYEDSSWKKYKLR